MLGIIGGTSLLFSTLPDLKKESVATPFGSADLLCGDIVMLMRHQHGRPPHRINLPGKPCGDGDRRCRPYCRVRVFGLA